MKTTYIKDTEHAINIIQGLGEALLTISSSNLLDKGTQNTLYGIGFAIIEQTDFLKDERFTKQG